MVTEETPPVMKNTGADDRGPEDSVCFMVQDGTSAAHPQTLLFFISNTPGLDEVSQKGQPKLVSGTHWKYTGSTSKALDPMLPPPPRAAQE